jgi:hypothetical protein
MHAKRPTPRLRRFFSLKAPSNAGVHACGLTRQAHNFGDSGTQAANRAHERFSVTLPPTTSLTDFSHSLGRKQPFARKRTTRIRN